MNDMKDKPLTIATHANRQPHYTYANKRITLNDIRRMVVAGKDLRFVDAQSGDDITIATLLYVIRDKERGITQLSRGVLIA